MSIHRDEVVRVRPLAVGWLRLGPRSGLTMRFLRRPKDPAETALCAIALVGLAVGLVFGLGSALDLSVSGLFYDEAQRNWPLTRDPILLAIRDFNAFTTRAIVAAAIIALLFAAAGGRSFTYMSPRVAVFLLATLIAAPGLIANALFKSHWGRPRPIEVTAFGGSLDFMPWWSPFGACDGNCSFVSGEAASAFSLLALAIMAPQRYRAAAAAAAIVYGLIVGLMRVAMGGHFLSDILFAGVFTALAIWLLHGVIFRWRSPGRSADAKPAAISPPPTRS
jgi:membrane-associated PAP2 superfamily phosphatase